MIVWWSIPEATDAQQGIQQVTTCMEQRLDRADSNKWKWMSIARSLARRSLSWWKRATFKDRIGATILRLFDVVNSTWLAFLVCAQTFGADQNCDCFSANWGPGDGYVDFQIYVQYKGFNVFYYWSFGTALSVVVMSASIAFITYEYCTQSHLSSEDYDQAMQGLRMVRSFKWHMIWCYKILASTIRMVRVLLNSILGAKISPRRNSLLWTPRRVGAVPMILDPMPGHSRTAERSSGPAHSRQVSRDHLLPLTSPTPEGSSLSRSSSEAAV